MKQTRPILLILSILSLGLLGASATRTTQSDRTVRDYYGIAFPDGAIVMVFYPDATERPLSDVQERFKAAWQWFQLPPK